MNQFVGGWSNYECLSGEDKAVFDKAMEHWVGVGYHPFAVRRQVVAGKNYEFLCNAIGIYPDAQWFLASVLIYKPLDSDPVIVKINSCDC